MKYAKNTIGYWLSKLPKGEREKALKYAKKDGTLERERGSIKDALWEAFTWDDTKEGWEYWANINERESPKERRQSPVRITHTIANPSTFRIDSVNPLTVSWEE